MSEEKMLAELQRKHDEYVAAHKLQSDVFQRQSERIAELERMIDGTECIAEALRHENAALTRKLADKEELFKYYWRHGSDALNKLLSEAREKADILQDSAFIAGTKFGWNCCVTNNESAYNAAVESRLHERTELLATASSPALSAKEGGE